MRFWGGCRVHRLNYRVSGVYRVSWVYRHRVYGAYAAYGTLGFGFRWWRLRLNEPHQGLDCTCYMPAASTSILIAPL